LKSIRLALHAEAPLRVSGDPILLAQALSNLIDNALKYAPENGLIDVTLRRRADSLTEIAVTDNGPGILDSEKAKVVERFYRGDASRGTPGVGLGLSLVQAIAKLHGSALELSDRHPGLSAVIAVPCSEPAAAAVGAPAIGGNTVSRKLPAAAAATTAP
jgi:signal transduction histidine kinase